MENEKRIIEGWKKLQQARREVEEILKRKRLEREAEKALKREAKNSPRYFLNEEHSRGVFEDKYLHLLLIGYDFPPTGDHSLNNILFAEFLKSISFLS